MLKILTSALVMMLVFASSMANAAECRRQIFFVNGVWNNTADDVERSAAELQAALAPDEELPANQYGVDGVGGVLPLWNPGDGMLADVLEVF